MTDIVIGGRRFSPQRSNLRSVGISIIVVLICLIVAYLIYGRIVSYVEPAAPVSATPLVTDVESATGVQLRFGASSLFYAGTIPVLRLTGDPRTIGAAHGRLLSSHLAGPEAGFAGPVAHAMARSGWLSQLTHDIRLRWRYRLLDDGIPGHQLVELAGLLGGARISAEVELNYAQLVRRQAALDVGMPVPWSAGADVHALTRSLSAITAMRGASGERLLIGRSFALPGAGDEGAAAAASLTVFVYQPEGVIPFASVGWAGQIGVVTGINAQGIAVMLHPVRASDVTIARNAQPSALLAREVLENARSLDDAISILQHASPLGAAAFVIADGNSRQWAVVERTPSRFAVQRNQPAVVTDLLTAAVFAEDPENDRAARIRTSAMRGQRAQRLLRTRVDDPADVVAMLRDRRGPSDTLLPLGHRGALRDVSAVHNALIDASGMVLWVADGPDASARFRAFDLRYELLGEGAGPAPPAALAGDPNGDFSAVRQVQSALRELRAARQHWHAGRIEQARELVHRAQIRAPDLPIALKLAGDLARAAGDRTQASWYYRRYLEGEPDDLGAAAKMRAFLANPVDEAPPRQ